MPKVASANGGTYWGVDLLYLHSYTNVIHEVRALQRVLPRDRRAAAARRVAGARGRPFGRGVDERDPLSSWAKIVCSQPPPQARWQISRRSQCSGYNQQGNSNIIQISKFISNISNFQYLFPILRLYKTDMSSLPKMSPHAC